MKLKVINIDGKKVEDIEISDKIFSLKPNDEMIRLLIDWQLNHLKPRTAKTKQRSEVRGSTSKIYAQKGTGGARHSSRKAPIFVGGGVAHGPKGAVYAEKTDLEIANTAKSPHKDAKASFQKQTWISKIGIYDEHNNLIAIALEIRSFHKAWLM